MSWELTVPYPPEFVGLKNYGEILFHDSRFWLTMRNTMVLILFGVGAQLVVGMVFALCLKQLHRFRGVVTTLFLMPVMITPIVGAFMWRMLYHHEVGALNYLLELVHLPPQTWTANPKQALFCIMLVDFWQWTPFMILILLSGLQAIPDEFYESAAVDGASVLQGFRYITIPVLIPIVTVAILVRLMDTFKLFDIVFVLTGGGPGITTETVSYYTYLQGFKFFSLGYAAALSYIQLILIIIAARFFLRTFRREAL